jgi:hypothetical protein
MLGLPVYPGAHFLRSYDAGRGQRYYIFGVQASFAEIVAYYRTVLRQRANSCSIGPPRTCSRWADTARRPWRFHPA